MNLKILKFAEGGASSSAFFYLPLAMATTGAEADTDMAKLIKALTAANKKSSSDDDKGKMTDKDFLALLKEVDGLPSDIVKLYKEAQVYWSNPTLNDSTIGGLMGSSSNANYSNFGLLLTKISLQAKIAKFNKEVWTKSRDAMFSNHSENEMAITDQGGIVIETKDGGMTAISVDTWKKNPYAYKTLTNADIMELRALKIPGNNALLNIVNGSTSIDAITEKLLKVISVAKDSNVESYISTDGFNTKAGLNVLKLLALRGLDPSTLTMAGVYKYTNKENADLVAHLISYAWGSLSSRERTLLSARAGRDGKGPDLLLKLLALGNTSYDVQLDYLDDINSDGSKRENKGKGKSKSEDKNWQDAASSNLTYLMLTGRGGTPLVYTFQPQNGGALMNLYGRFYGGMMKPSGEIIGKTSIEALIRESGLLSVSNTKCIYFGNKKVDDLSRVAYLNSGGMRVILPAVKDALGNVAPNFALIDDYEKALKRIFNLNPNDPMYLKKLAQILSDYPSLASLLINGRPNPDKFSAFVVVDGETDENNVGDGLKYAMTLKSGDDEYDALADILYPSKSSSSKSTHTREVPGVHFWGNDKLYKAPVFIPIVSQNPGDSLVLSSKFNVELTKLLGDLAATKSAPMQSSSSSLLNN